MIGCKYLLYYSSFIINRIFTIYTPISLQYVLYYIHEVKHMSYQPNNWLSKSIS